MYTNSKTETRSVDTFLDGSKFSVLFFYSFISYRVVGYLISLSTYKIILLLGTRHIS